jgi:hypothetical protein
MKTFRRIIAREWLWFLALAAFGFLLLPPMFLVVAGLLGAYVDTGMITDYYRSLASFSMRSEDIVWGLLPYAIVLLSRSIIWSASVLRHSANDRTGHRVQ